MMNRFLQADVFRKGVSKYLKKYKFSNAIQDDLWASLTEEAHAQGKRLSSSLFSNITLINKRKFLEFCLCRMPGGVGLGCYLIYNNLDLILI